MMDASGFEDEIVEMRNLLKGVDFKLNIENIERRHSCGESRQQLHSAGTNCIIHRAFQHIQPSCGYQSYLVVSI